MFRQQLLNFGQKKFNEEMPCQDFVYIKDYAIIKYLVNLKVILNSAHHSSLLFYERKKCTRICHSCITKQHLISNKLIGV